MAVLPGSVPVRSSLDGPRMVVADFLKDPYALADLVFSMLKQQFLVDSLLRKAGPLDGPAMKYTENEPLYADDDAEIRGEWAEVPVAVTSRGTPKVAYVDERALAIMISDRMKRWRNTDEINKQAAKVKNTMVMSWEKAFIKVLLDAIVQTVPGTAAAWDMTGGSASVIRQNIISARKLVATAAAPGQDIAYGFRADTLVVSEGRGYELMGQEDFNKPFLGNIADENLLYTGKLPNKIAGLDVVMSRILDDDIALVMQRKVVGAIGDDLPLQSTALYRDEPRKSERSDTQRASAIAIDNPLAMAAIDLS